MSCTAAKSVKPLEIRPHHAATIYFHKTAPHCYGWLHQTMVERFIRNWRNLPPETPITWLTDQGDLFCYYCPLNISLLGLEIAAVNAKIHHTQPCDPTEPEKTKEELGRLHLLETWLEKPVDQATLGDLFADWKKLDR